MKTVRPYIDYCMKMAIENQSKLQSRQPFKDASKILDHFKNPQTTDPKKQVASVLRFDPLEIKFESSDMATALLGHALLGSIHSLHCEQKEIDETEYLRATEESLLDFLDEAFRRHIDTAEKAEQVDRAQALRDNRPQLPDKVAPELTALIKEVASVALALVKEKIEDLRSIMFAN